tara:strand:+ start:2596 stop:3249 length:654 start_codon:yes stop_codon:yes gene_type:complete
MSQFKNFHSTFLKSVISAKRDIEEIELIAVSKKKPADAIINVINEGHLSFGENQLQEIESKWIDLKKDYPRTKLHFIGSIQSRKIKSIFNYCDEIHSIDRIKIVKEIKKLETETKIEKDYFLQINTGDEIQKSGIAVSDADQFISQCIDQYNFNIKGLMCIPPLNDDPRSHFNTLRDIASNHRIKFLSMGMSDDYDIAIQCGATHIRIGTSIFGSRN